MTCSLLSRKPSPYLQEAAQESSLLCGILAGLQSRNQNNHFCKDRHKTLRARLITKIFLNFVSPSNFGSTLEIKICAARWMTCLCGPASCFPCGRSPIRTWLTPSLFSIPELSNSSAFFEYLPSARDSGRLPHKR